MNWVSGHSHFCGSRMVSGPFLLREGKPGDHFTLVSNPKYYLAPQGCPTSIKTRLAQLIQELRESI